MKIIKTIFLFSFILTIQISYSQFTNKIEITKTDFVSLPQYNASNLLAFGVGLGMSQSEVESILSKNSNLFFEEDTSNHSKDYVVLVYRKSSSSPRVFPLMKLTWKDAKDELTKINFLRDFESYTSGLTEMLFSRDQVNWQDDPIRNFFGDPEDVKITLEIPEINVYHKTFYYYGKGFEIIYKNENGFESSEFAIFR